jgi:uncharacterized delta-60 repeat protein
VGSSGEVSVTLTTSDGTAVAGTDYLAVSTTVFFGDGDTEDRLVTVPVVSNRVTQPDRTINLTLSQPGGCAALGAHSAAVLTIVDDDAAPPVSSFAVGGTVSGLVGSGLVIEEIKSGGVAAPTADGSFTFSIRRNNGQLYEARIKSQPLNPVQTCSVVANGQGTVADADVTNIAVQCVTSPAGGAALDLGFGSEGRVFNGTLGGSGEAVALQPDGKIVVLGQLGMFRYQPNGVLDTSFGATGTVAISGFFDIHDLAVQPDGKIVVAGVAIVSSRRRMAVARFNADGSIDAGFGSAGRTVTHPADMPEAASSPAKRVLVATDGKLLLAIAHGEGLAAVRLNADGTLDTSFGGGDGSVVVDLGRRTEITAAKAVQSDGKILLAGRVDEVDNIKINVGVARLNTDGTLDTSYGTGGTTQIDVPGDGAWDEAADLVMLPGDRAAVAVAAQRGATFAFTLARLAADGRLEGASFTPIGPRSDFSRAVAVQVDGKVVLVGEVSSMTTANDFGIARYNADGSLDASFGTGGVLTLDFFGGSDGANDIVIQPDGKLLVVGRARNGSSNGVGMVRLLP